MIVVNGPETDGFDPQGYDESQRAEILEVERGGPDNGMMQTDLDPDLGEDPDAVQDEEEDELTIIGEDDDDDDDDDDIDDDDDEEEDDDGIVPLDGETAEDDDLVDAEDDDQL